MAIRTVNNLRVPPTGISSVDELLPTMSANGTYTVPDMSEYAWIILIGVISGNPHETITLPYNRFASGEPFTLVNYYSQTARTITVTYVSDTSVSVTARNNLNIKIVGVK